MSFAIRVVGSCRATVATALGISIYLFEIGKLNLFCIVKYFYTKKQYCQSWPMIDTCSKAAQIHIRKIAVCQNRILRTIGNAPYYVHNDIQVQNDLRFKPLEHIINKLKDNHFEKARTSQSRVINCSHQRSTDKARRKQFHWADAADQPCWSLKTPRQLGLLSASSRTPLSCMCSKHPLQPLTSHFNRGLQD